MNSNRMIITYIILSLLLIGSAAVLAKQVRHFMNEREDPTEPFQGAFVNPDVVKEDLKRKEAENQRDILLTFSQTTSFRELATPVPKPTATPIPPPTPTPVVPAKGWMIDFATKKYAFLIAPDKQPVTAQLGKVVKNNYGEDFTVLEIIPDIEYPRVKVKEVNSGVVGEINQQVSRAGQR